MAQKFVLEKNLKLVLALVALTLFSAMLLGFAVNTRNPISGIVTIIGSLARSFSKI